MADYSNPYQSEIVGLDRQRKLADMLLKQGMDQNNMQGQMVSGRYVGASPWQGIANLANIYVAKELGKEADTEQQKIADRLRRLGQDEVSNIMQTAKGREASQEQLAGPYDVSQGIQKPVIDYAAIKANPDAALTMAAAAQTPEGRAFAPALMANALPKDITPFEKRSLELREKEIGIQAANANKPQIIETQEGYFAVDPRNPNKVVPVTFNGQVIAGKKGDLPEFQGKSTNYGIQMSTGMKEMNDLEKGGFNPATFANQSALAVSGSKVGNVAVPSEVRRYKQAMDNFANAYIRFQSGANVPEHEIQRNLKNMMPQVGDEPIDLEQKARARDEALRGIKITAGQGARYIPNPYATRTNPDAPPAPKGPMSFSSEADAAKAGLPNGTKVIINGVAGTWTN